MQAVTDDVVNLRTQAQGAGTAGRLLLKTGIAIVGAAGWLLGSLRLVHWPTRPLRGQDTSRSHPNYAMNVVRVWKRTR